MEELLTLHNFVKAANKNGGPLFSSNLMEHQENFSVSNKGGHGKKHRKALLQAEMMANKHSFNNHGATKKDLDG